jgi:hypothetical protein
MTDMPIARKKRTSYESFVAECPSCGVESIFNRASDLGSFEPIAGRDVACLSAACGKPFRIVGDSINNPHEMLINDCYELIEQKHYMNCILSLTTAYEMFFRLFFRVELLFKPFAGDPNHDLDEMNRLDEKLQKKIKQHTFDGMRALFLQHILNAQSPKNLVDSANMIAVLPTSPKCVNPADIESLGDTKLAPLLKAIKDANINTLRNRIVHKEAYRPRRDEAELALKKTTDILFPLQDYFQLHDDINCQRGIRTILHHN